jgi:hypothetical protein
MNDIFKTIYQVKLWNWWSDEQIRLLSKEILQIDDYITSAAKILVKYKI